MEKMIDKTGPKFHFHSDLPSPLLLPSDQLSIFFQINFPSTLIATCAFSALDRPFTCSFVRASYFSFCDFFLSQFLTFDILESAVKSISWHSLLWKNLSDHLSLVHLSAHCAFFSGLVPICGLPQEIYLPFAHFPL